MGVPKFFESVLWSHNVAEIDAGKSPNLLITQAINYGDLRHWRWITSYYGAEEVRRVLTSLPVSALRSRSRALAEIVFSIPYDHASITPRGSHS